MRNPFNCLSIFAMTLVCLTPAGTSADDLREEHCAALKPGRPRFSEGIGILYSKRVSREVVEGAVDLWAACEGYGTDFPPFVVGGEGTRTIAVELHDVSSGIRCASFVRGNIVLYRYSRDSQGRMQSCGSRADGLAHELGHVLGLRDAPVIDECRDHAMAYVDLAKLDRRAVRPDECRLVGARWVTLDEGGADLAPMAVAVISNTRE
jgi:hypothetical protein